MQSHDDRNISRNSKEMTIIVSFCDLVVCDQLRTLDLTEVPKILRFHIYDKLRIFRGLRSLVLGSGTGGWSNMYIEKFSAGVMNMKNLVRFSLCYDCTDHIIKLLTRNCKHSLRIVDVEMSMQVTDASAECLSSCKHIHTLHIFHTGITMVGHGVILTKLKDLKLLVRGGFLCEALEYIEENMKHLPTLELEEFWSSEEYFFHDDRQMALVARMCPKMRKMMFQFSTEVMTDLLFLTKFSQLSELHLWGGEFYLDRINLVITMVGIQLSVLFLIHTEELDENGIILISRHCPHLVTLGFYNCEFKERMIDVTDEDLLYFPRREKEEMEPMLELKSLAIVSECEAKIALLIISAALNLEHFKTGIHCQLTDENILKIFEKNKLQHLKSLNIPMSKYLSLATIELLLDHCAQLQSIQDLNYWESVSRQELKAFRKEIKEDNFDIDVGIDPVEREDQKHLDDLNDDIINFLRGNLE